MSNIHGMRAGGETKNTTWNTNSLLEIGFGF